ncbi:MAG: glycosyltransferase family 39 protein [Deltaproteobacteria bacterium]|nr:glycosyltransferase family 39 protein [Deltaproteobacteria bacterium]MBW2399759.1 glycosyltransferase family 39 protein [Deltaproteobacteria bacterium]MBW2666552.1 glycosyltransferase family 39 protein [Deltaproteobacteria bacterium]
MTRNGWKALGRLARRLALLAACLALLGYLFVAFARVDYPFEIEWMEGGSRGHVARILAGEKLYAQPSLAFTAFAYTPLYYHVASWPARLLGEGFLPLRLVSLLASLGCFALVGSFVARESGDRNAGLLAAGLLVACFDHVGAWFDVARVDSLFVFFTLAAMHLLRFGNSLWAGLLAGLLGGCAFFTKQTALAVLAPFLLCAVVERGRLWIAFVATLIAVVGGGSLLLDAVSDGWFSYYAFELPTHRRLEWWKLERFWRLDVLARLPVAAAAVVVYFGALRLSALDGRRLFYACLALGTLGASLASRIQLGGYSNALMPACAGLAIFFGLGIAAALEAETMRRRPAAEFLIYGLCLIQFALLAYDPWEQIPSEADRRAGERLVATIRGFDGEVLVPWHGYLAGLAGSPATAQWMAITDVLRGGNEPVREQLRAEIRSAIRERRFAAIVVDRPWYEEDMNAHYELAGDAFDDDGVFWPQTGLRTRPEQIYVPKQADAP